MAHKRPLRESFKIAARKAVLVPLFAIAAVCGTPATAHDVQLPNLPNMPSVAFPLRDTVVMPRPARDKDAGGPDAPKLTYDQQVFQYNAPDAKALPVPEQTRLSQMTAAERQTYYMGKLCMAPNAVPAAGNAKQQQISEAVTALNALPVSGKPLVDHAVSAKIALCNLDNLPAGVGAQYLPVSDAIISAPDAQRVSYIMHMAHEMLHAAQDAHGLLNYERDWDIKSRVTRNLSIEAAALAEEMMVAYEVKEAGDQSYWVYMKFRFEGTEQGKETLRLVEKSYADTIAAGGTKDDALRAFGKTAWTRVFENDDWLKYYLNVELMSYASDIEAETFKNKSDIAHDGFGADKVAMVGQVDNNKSFTSGAAFPEMDALLKRHPKMRWAYQLAEIARLQQMGQDKAAQSLKAVATLENNPYLGLDITGLYRQSQEASWGPGTGHKFRYLYEYMDDAIKPSVPAIPGIVPNLLPPQLPPTPAVPPVIAPPVVAHVTPAAQRRAA